MRLWSHMGKGQGAWLSTLELLNQFLEITSFRCDLIYLLKGLLKKWLALDGTRLLALRLAQGCLLLELTLRAAGNLTAKHLSHPAF